MKDKIYQTEKELYLCARDYKDPKCVEIKENALIELTQGQSQYADLPIMEGMR